MDLSCLFYLLRFSVIITTTIRFTQHDTSMFSKKTNKQHNQVETWRSTCWSWSTSGPIRSKTGFPTLESSETAIVIIDDVDGLSERYGTICFFMSSWDIWRWFPETLTNLTFPASSKVLKPIQSSVYSLVYNKIQTSNCHSCQMKPFETMIKGVITSCGGRMVLKDPSG